MGRAPGNGDEKEGTLRKGPWTTDEDRKLVAYIQEHGHGSWRVLPKNAGRPGPPIDLPSINCKKTTGFGNFS